MAKKELNNVNINVEFEETANRQQLSSGDNIKTLFGKIQKYFSDLKSVAFSGDYNDLSNTPTLSSLELVLSGTVDRCGSEDVSTGDLSGFYLLVLSNTGIPERCIGILSCLGYANTPHLLYLVGSGTTSSGFDGRYTQAAVYYGSGSVGITITASDSSNLSYYIYKIPV